jgi:hypothetical protein
VSPSNPTTRPALRGGMVAAGAAACAVCCAAPLMALLGIGVTGAAATALIAAFAGLVFAFVVAAAIVTAVRRRSRQDSCATEAPGPVSIELDPRPRRP